MSSKLLWGFTLGLVAGLLLAPEKGSESRRKLRRAARDLKNKFNDFVDGVNDKFESLRNETEEVASDGRQEARSFANSEGKIWEG